MISIVVLVIVKLSFKGFKILDAKSRTVLSARKAALSAKMSECLASGYTTYRPWQCHPVMWSYLKIRPAYIGLGLQWSLCRYLLFKPLKNSSYSKLGVAAAVLVFVLKAVVLDLVWSCIFGLCLKAVVTSLFSVYKLHILYKAHIIPVFKNSLCANLS